MQDKPGPRLDLMPDIAAAAARLTAPLAGSSDIGGWAPLSAPAALEGSAEITAAKPVWSLDQIVDNLERANLAYQTTTVEYSFAAVAPAGADSNWVEGWEPFSADQKAAARAIFQLFSDTCGLTFVEVADNGQSPSADNQRITFNQSTSIPHYGFTAWDAGEPDPEGARELNGASIWISSAPQLPPQDGYEPGDNWFRSLMHEMLHAMGFFHPGPYNGPGASYEDDAVYRQDTLQYTNLSYFEETFTGADFGHGGVEDYYAYHGAGWAMTPLLHDIAALQDVYGANTGARTGNTVYGFKANAGASYDFKGNDQPVFCIWDAGGRDTLNASRFAAGAVIDLRQGAFSDVGGLKSNISIAYGAVIENATGGAGDDQIKGNAAANRLDGGAGDDRLSGYEGRDLLVGGAGRDMLTGGAGRDVFRFEAAVESTVAGADRVKDLGADDIIDLGRIDADPTLAGDQAFHLVDAFTGARGELVLSYKAANDVTLLSGDIDGDGKADFRILLSGDHANFEDFVL